MAFKRDNLAYTLELRSVGHRKLGASWPRLNSLWDRRVDFSSAHLGAAGVGCHERMA